MNRTDYSRAAVNDRRPPNYNCRYSNFRPPPPEKSRPYPPEKPPDPRPPNFILELRSTFGRGGGFRRDAVSAVVKNCCRRQDNYVVLPSGAVAGRVFFTEWSAALGSVVAVWKTRLSGAHELTPALIPNVFVPSDVDELNERLRPLFSDKIKGLVCGETVNKWAAKVAAVGKEIDRIDAGMRKHRHAHVFFELSNKKNALLAEKKLILKRIDEFKSAMRCIHRHIMGRPHPDDSIAAFRFKDGINWARVYSLILRECRRLDVGLPIYACRRDILQLVASQQIMVLVGETGSGKSTQLVQFLADSGLVGNGSVICTQPRKIAAISLEHRVQEECHGCYEDNYVSCLPYYSSACQFKGNLIYMTDHCLLQHCMNDRNLKGVSCILVDEAHERSLNTDLLLAMLKRLLPYRSDLRLVIMSATADAQQLSTYFFGCKVFPVKGRNFPVDVKYVPWFEGAPQSVTAAAADTVAPYVLNIVKMVTEIHKTEQEGTVLAFLTSATEVEWACERFQVPDAEPLALHGKLSYDEQSRVFQHYPGKRKIIFATNVAETSLTIPGVKFVVDSGMMKESRFEPGSGMNVLRVCWVSKSSANQRAGRAGRTEAGRCYRLYSQGDFDLMAAQQEPEIRRVHLGVAVLKIVALGIKNVKEFDFVDAPSPDAIDMAIRNLVQLGAVTLKNGDLELTDDGRYLVKLGIEPRLGKLILSCFSERLGKEGLVLAAVMANSSSIFCRVGSQSDKLKSDCLKVPFCHADGDLFTLLSVFKAWESEDPGRRNRWCWENSINAKTMRRCHDTISELENCLKSELQIVVTSYWNWTPEKPTVHHRNLKKAILASLAENVAMFSGCDGLGYKVALTGQHVPLHPSCSLLMFSHKADWVVFGEILAASCQYLVCVTAFDREFLSSLTPPPLFDPCRIENQKLQLTKLSGIGTTVLKRFCGKSNNGLINHMSRIRAICGDDRIRVEVDYENNVVQLFSSPRDAEKVLNLLKGCLECERGWLLNECMERCLYPGVSPPVALFGSGAEIKHLELDKRSLTVDVFHPNVSAVDDKELLMCVGNYASGVCSVHKSRINPEIKDQEKWGSITFLTPDAAEKAAKAAALEKILLNGSKLRLVLSRATFGVERAFSFPAVEVKLFWPRKLSNGVGRAICNPCDVGMIIRDLSNSNLLFGERYIQCTASSIYPNSIKISGIDKLASDTEILHLLRSATERRILDFYSFRGGAVGDSPPCHDCEEMLLRELSVFMPKGSPQINFCSVHVRPPHPEDWFMKASVTFDGRLHLEAAKALEQIEGTALPGFQPWQKIQCQRLFHTSVSCHSSIYSLIKRELDSLVTGFKDQGIECFLNENANGSARVKIIASATRTVAELRRPLEELMKGRTISHASLTPAVFELLFSRDGKALLKSLEREMGVYVLYDKQRLQLTILGPSDKAIEAEKRLIRALLNLYEDRQQDIHLRGAGLPSDLMKEVVCRFGPHLERLKEKVPSAEVTLNTRRHVISICGSKEAKQKVEEIVNEIAQASGELSEFNNDGEACPICFCEVEEGYQLESCMHVFCRSCLIEQCESAIRNKDGFPIRCYHEGCKVPIWLVDLKNLLSSDKLHELFVASVVAFVASSCGAYRFCPSPDCPSIYKVAKPDEDVKPFLCGACYAKTCTKCHFEDHPSLSCEMYKQFKEDPDASLKGWWRGKEEFVKPCPGCGYTIEKAEGCNHVECKCGRHLCWVCLQHFVSSEDCYSHLRAIHQGIT